MANESVIRPSALPVERTTPAASEFIMVDNGVTVARSKISDVVGAGRPLANQTEAEAGVNATKAMTPLTTKQAIDAQVPGVVTGQIAALNLGTAAQSDVGDFATTAQGALADTALQPGDLTAIYVPEVSDIADVPSSALNVYVSETGRFGTFSAVDNTNGDYDDLIAADTVGGEIVVSSGDPNLVYVRQRGYSDPFKVSEFDGDLAVTLAVAEKRSALMGGGRVTVLINIKGRVVLPASITVPKNVSLIGLGSNDTILDFNTATLSAPDTGLLPLAIKAWGGGLTEVPIEWTTTAVGEAYLDMDEDPSAYAEDGAVYIVYDSTDGSWLDLANRPYYRRGEMKRQVRREGNRLWFDRAFRDVYASGGSVKLYKMGPYRGDIGGFSIDMTGRAIAAEDAIDIRFGDNNDVNDLRSFGAGYSGIQWNICYGLKLRNSFATTRVREVFPGSGNPGNDYGIVYSNSTGNRIYDCSATANWHALSLGGGDKIGCVPTYDTIVDGGHYVSTYNVQAVDMHGICDMTRYKNLIVDGPVAIAGKDSSYENCKITSVKTGRSGGGPDLAVAGTEIRGGLFEFINCDIYSDCQGGGPSGGTGHGGFDFSFEHAYVARKEELFLHVMGGSVNFPNETRPFYFANFGATHSTSVHIDTELTLPSALAAGIVRIAGSPTNVAKYFRIKQVSAAAAGSPYAVWANSYTASAYEFPDQSGTVTVTGNTGVSFVSNTVTPKHGYPIAPLVDAWAPGGSIAGRLVVGSCNPGNGVGPWTVFANSAPGTNFGNTNTGTMAWRASLRA